MSEQLQKVKDLITQAVKTTDDQHVKLVAVSKTASSESISNLYQVGHRDFAESRPQALRDKSKELGHLEINWHFIGPLQKNKIKYVYPVACLVHSIDTEELLLEFSSWYEKTGRKCPVLLEVNISEEDNKKGFKTDEILGVIENYNNNPSVDIRGLMGMAPFTDDKTAVRNSFRVLGDIFDKSRKLQGSSYSAKELSMGMSNDYLIAIEEGATIVRVGSAIFG